MKKPGASEKLLITILALFLFSLPNLIESHSWQNIPVFFRSPAIQAFTVFLMAIVLEALPFILIGSVISGLIEVYLPEEAITRIFEKKNTLLLIPVAGLLGLALPICECGIIPVIRRLLKKGVPFSVAITYMLTGPIINVTVLASTSLAFWKEPKIIFWRPVLAFLVGTTIGFASKRFEKTAPLPAKESLKEDHCCEECCGEEHHHHSKNWLTVFSHAGDDFFLMGKYLIVGALVASFVQVGLPRENLLIFSHNLPLAITALMALAFLLNLCSESDAFVASTFVQFPAAAKIAFLVSGPMLDFKMILMFFSIFRKRYIIFLAASIAVLVFICTYFLGVVLR
ncbi:MAG: permease [Candidatus Omnitrophica bacterium]|nr:permease [Candidatus Omnitrophota bacterium]